MGRFTYSRWDGTQVGFEVSAEDILSELTDEVLYHGDLNQALRRPAAVCDGSSPLCA